MDRRKILVGAVSSAAIAGLFLSTALGASGDSNSPTKAEALAGVSAAKTYVEQHPGDAGEDDALDGAEALKDYITGFVEPTTPPTTTPSTSAFPQSVTAVPASNKITLSWQAPTSGTPTGYIYGRNGTDNTGTGPWTSPAQPASLRTVVLDKLVNGTAYTVFVEAVYASGNKRVSLTATAGASSTTPPPTTTVPPTTVPPTTVPPTTVPPTTTPPPAGNRASGMPWSDGVWAEHDAGEASAFASWRGAAVDNVAAFTSRENWNAQLGTWWLNSIPSSFVKSRDDFVLGVPLWTDDGAAGTDAQWRQLADAVYGADPEAYVRLGWEFNCCFSRATNVSAWRAQYSRAYTLMKDQHPTLRIGFNPNEGISTNGVSGDPSALYVEGKADWIGIDAYDWWPAYNSAANIQNHFTKQWGWNYWYDFAVSKGVPFALPEWGVYSGSSASGGDNPQYMNAVYNWLKSKHDARPGSIGFVTYFNETASYCGCAIYPTTRNPNAAAAYRAQIQALTH